MWRKEIAYISIPKYIKNYMYEVLAMGCKICTLFIELGEKFVILLQVSSKNRCPYSKQLRIKPVML